MKDESATTSEIFVRRIRRKLSGRGNNSWEVVIAILEAIVSIIRRKFWNLKATEMSGLSLADIVTTAEELSGGGLWCDLEPVIMLSRFQGKDFR
jgi:hypothetical protein